MRIFGIFKRNKRAPGPPSGPNSNKNSVHPAKINRRGGFAVKRSKVKERLGVETVQECQEIDKLLDQACWTSSLSDQDVDSIGSSVTEETELEIERFCDHTVTPEAKHRIGTSPPPSFDCIEPTAHLLAQHAHLPPFKSYGINRHCDEHAVQSISPVSKPVGADSGKISSTTYRQARPPKLSCVSKSKGASSATRVSPSPPERSTALHACLIGNKKVVNCSESFPLPLPFEKQCLPTRQRQQSDGAFLVAHPLPQPPLTVVKSFEDKDQTSVVRAVSYEPPNEPHLTAKEYETIVRAVSCEPHKQKMQRFRGGGSQVLLDVSQTTGPTAVQPQAYHTPQSTPPTTPKQQASRMSPPTTPKQQASRMSYSTPPATPPSHAQGTPQNTPPRTPRLQSLHVLPEGPSITSQAQRFWTSHNTPTSTPRWHVHPQILANKTEKMQVPSCANLQSPRSKLQIQNQSPVSFPIEQTHCAYSPPSSPLRASLCPRNWLKGVLLGRGTFGDVYEGFNLEDGSFFAVKMSSKVDVSPEIQQEVDVLSKLDHPNIVRYLGSSIVEKQLCIFLELVTMGSLDFILRKYKRLEEHTIRNYTKQILLGLEYLHRKRTIHRDIKCSNILVDVNGQVKVADFGIAKQVGESLASSVKGTPLYMAPEVLGSIRESYSFPADIWSLGCTVLEMADGKPPWSDLQGFAFLFKVKNGELPRLPKHLSPEGRDFIQQCLMLRPEDRPTASQLLQHPFVLNATTPETLLIRSAPPSPVVPLMWLPSLQTRTNTWANGECCPVSPNPVTVGYQRAKTLVQGR